MPAKKSAKKNGNGHAKSRASKPTKRESVNTTPPARSVDDLVEQAKQMSAGG